MAQLDESENLNSTSVVSCSDTCNCNYHYVVLNPNINININNSNQKNKVFNESKRIDPSKYDHSSESKINESHTQYEQVTISDAATLAAVEAIGFYAVDLAIEQTVLSTFGAELAYALGISAWGGAVGIAAAGVAATAIYLKQQSSDSKYSKQKECNAKIQLFNEKHKLLMEKSKECSVLKEKLESQEEWLNKSKNLKISYYMGRNCVSIMLIGPTGYGKSLLANRIVGNKESVFDLCDESNQENLDFEVAENGDTNSKTEELEKAVRKVQLVATNENENENDRYTVLKEFNLLTIDTPGAFDSKGRTEYFQNEMSEFCKICGGVNAFAIFFKLGLKMDDNYIELLKKYVAFWGKDIWKQCMIIITHCDLDGNERRNSITKKALAKTIATIRKDLKKISKGVCDDNVPIFTFGESNFEESLHKLYDALNDVNGRFSTKFSVDKIKSPYDKLWKELNEKNKELRALFYELNELKNGIESIKKEVS